MAIDLKVDTVSNKPESKEKVSETQSDVKVVADVNPVKVSKTDDLEKTDKKDDTEQKEKEPAKSTVESTISELNSRMKSTRCEYGYDDPTNTITIKVYDKETDELIREVPPEKSLDVLKKVWELAGLIVDEKR